MEKYTPTTEKQQELKIHTVSSGEWLKLRDVRIRAIQDSPQAFGDTIEETASRGEEEWRKWTRGNLCG